MRAYVDVILACLSNDSSVTVIGVDKPLDTRVLAVRKVNAERPPKFAGVAADSCPRVTQNPSGNLY